MKFHDLSDEQKFEMFQAYQNGELTSKKDVDAYLLSKEPSMAAKALAPIDTGVSKAANFVKPGLQKLKEFAEMHPGIRAQSWARDKLMGALGEIPNPLDLMGVPKGPELNQVMPKTVAATGFNPNARDLGLLIALEGVGQMGSALKGYGARGMVRAFEEGKPPMPLGASKEIASDILEKNYLPHHEAANDVITNAMLGLKEKGLGASEAAKKAADAQNLSISPQRIEQLHEYFPEHPVVKNLKGRLDASREGQITRDFVEEKPGYVKQEKILTPSETIQAQAEQGDLFDRDYYANPDAYSKKITDFVNHPDRGTFPAQPEIQKPIEPELAGESVKIPADYEFRETQIPPEGHYDFKPDSLYDLFSYANKNRHKAWQRDPITGQPLAKNAGFGEMMQGLRSDLRSVQEPLSEEQIHVIKRLDPEFEGKTVGEGVAALNSVTTESIKDQKIMSKGTKPLSFMEGVYSNPDKRAFAQRLQRDSGLGSLLEYADKYGASKDYAEALADYAKKSVKPEGINYHKLGRHLMYGATLGNMAPSLALEAGELMGSPVRRYGAANSVGGALEKLKPTSIFNIGE